MVIGNPPFAGTGLKDLLQLLASPQRRGAEANLFGSVPDEPTTTNGAAPSPRQTLEHLVRQLAGYVCWRFRGRLAEQLDEADEPGLFAGAPTETATTTPGRVDDELARPILEWPSDRPLDTRRPAVRTAIQRMASTAIEVYFVERFLRLAKPGGMVAMIVPDSILSSDQLAPLRSWFMQNAQILAVVTLPRHVFTGVGAKAATGIVFARRYTEAERRKNEQGRAAGAKSQKPAGRGDRKVLLTAPCTNVVDWDLNGYLADVLAVARTSQAPAEGRAGRRALDR